MYEVYIFNHGLSDTRNAMVMDTHDVGLVKDNVMAVGAGGPLYATRTGGTVT